MGRAGALGQGGGGGWGEGGGGGGGWGGGGRGGGGGGGAGGGGGGGGGWGGGGVGGGGGWGGGVGREDIMEETHYDSPANAFRKRSKDLLWIGSRLGGKNTRTSSYWGYCLISFLNAPYIGVGMDPPIT